MTRIATRAERAKFYCADCRKTYQKCKCKVYRSVDTLKEGKSAMFQRSTGQLRCCVCGITVKNENLGGYSGRSALTGRCYCQHCEDVGGCL